MHGRIIVRRHKEILTRKRYITTTDGECYFYNRLLQIRAWRSEDEIYEGYDTYRERYLSMFPSERQILREETRSYITHMRSQLTSQCNEIVNSLIISLQQHHVRVIGFNVLCMSITMAERENMSHRFNVYVTIDYGFFVYDFCATIV